MSGPLENAAQHFPDGFRLLIREESTSTNDELHQLANQGAEHGLVLVAKNQTAGRGRRGATWHASPDEGLTFSVLIRPKEPKALWPRLALATGLAVAEATERFGIETQIKWPNDLWIHGRKVAGILVEAGNHFAIIGIGINVLTTTFPTDIAPIATSLQLECGRPLDRNAILAAIIQRLALRHQHIGTAFPEVIHAIRQRCALSGQRVSLLTAQGPLHGTVIEIGDHGELKLKTPTGIQSLIQADEIRLQP